jgi:sigma-B regulation protein RsbU (phosphoserine phosphatase)
MAIDIAQLKNSKQFLNTVLENMDTAVFLVDAQLNICQFNSGFLNLFHPESDNVTGVGFGQVAGCANAVLENRACGNTSKCNACALRQSLARVVSDCRPGQKQFLERTFYIHGRPVIKYLEFTCHPVEYGGRRMILVFIHDLTPVEESKQRLKKKQRQLDIDLEKAGEIQRSLLPGKQPGIDGIDVDWFFAPSQKVGGDVFHIYKENDSLVSGYMLDVSGHGVSAALVAVMVKQFLDHLHIKGLKRGRPHEPGQILALLEQQFPFERFESYLTIVSLLLDARSGRLTYGCAGHVPPVIVSENRTLQVLDQCGAIIGIGLNDKAEQYATVLSPADKLVVYTDGLVDYFGKKGALSNMDKFYQTLQSLSSCSAEQMVKQVVSQRNINGGRFPADDISLMVLQYLS